MSEHPPIPPGNKIIVAAENGRLSIGAMDCTPNHASDSDAVGRYIIASVAQCAWEDEALKRFKQYGFADMTAENNVEAWRLWRLCL